MHVGLITYQTGHLKTWQILQKLRTKSFKVTIFAFPFKPRPQKGAHFQDRPYQLTEFNVHEYNNQLGVTYVEVGGWEDEFANHLDYPSPTEKPDVYLTCIAKIIPGSFISGRPILNAHPGLLPENRGLDAFKWSIFKAEPVGISLHAIDEHIDRGILLHKIKIPIHREDTLRTVADRAYEMECDLQANFDYYMVNLNDKNKVSDLHPLSKNRIPPELDAQLESIFQDNKEALVQHSLTP